VVSFEEYGLFFDDSTGLWESRPVPDTSPAGQKLRRGGVKKVEKAEAAPPASGMTLDITVGAGTWNDIETESILEATLERITLLPEGTKKGRDSVELLFRLEDGRYVHASTTYALWQGASSIFEETPHYQSHG
jgi:hypothetical protein